jgi:hypothetical protein
VVCIRIAPRDRHHTDLTSRPITILGTRATSPRPIGRRRVRTTHRVLGYYSDAPTPKSRYEIDCSNLPDMSGLRFLGSGSAVRAAVSREK